MLFLKVISWHIFNFLNTESHFDQEFKTFPKLSDKKSSPMILIFSSCSHLILVKSYSQMTLKVLVAFAE